MSFLTKRSLSVKIPEFSITVIVFLVGCIFSLYILFSVKSVAEFVAGFKNPLFFSLYYLWIKAIIIDVQRISEKTESSHYFPGFVYYIYASQWVIYWLINDMAFSSSQLSSVFIGNSPWIVSLYFSNSSLFWLILDIVSSILLIPLQRMLTKHKTINSFLLLDYLKFLLIFIVFTLVSLF